ncbi:MAG: aspartate aminotransferase family protein [Calditrichaeota bacterium]|nr:aspartate aminotransferase family protein [Calditrichota bacterium]
MDQVIEQANRYLLGTYKRPDLVFVRGEGSYLIDASGKRYLDFVSGIAVNALGYGHPAILKAIHEQVDRVIHTSNLYHTEPQARLAALLVENSFADRVFFANSGAEAVEAALKFARKWAKSTFGREKVRILAFKNSFHGRTFAALTATGQRKYRRGYEPMLPGFRHAVFNDLASAEALIDDRTAAILVEPVQGEGGIRPATVEFLKGLRELATKHNALLIFDEIQCSLGRTGDLFAYQTYGVEPDVLVLAKPLGGGLPLSAVLVKEDVAGVIKPGDHGSTFGGNPVACAAGEAFLRVLLEEDIPTQVKRKGRVFREYLDSMKAESNSIRDVRGLGLMLGMEFARPVGPLADAAREQGLLLCPAGKKVLRFLPPLTVAESELQEAARILWSVVQSQLS